MKNKELIRCQTRYFDILSEFNFQIIFRLGKKNGKANTLTRISDFKFKNNNNKKNQFQYQIIFISDRVQINIMNIKVGFFERIFEANKIDESCEQYRKIVVKKNRKFNEIKLK